MLAVLLFTFRVGRNVQVERGYIRKHSYSNILKISPPKTESFQIKILIFFIFLLKT